MRAYLLAAGLALVAAPAAACLTGHSTGLLLPQRPAGLRGALLPFHPPDAAAAERRIRALEEALDRGRADERDLTDLGVLYAAVGRLHEAREILLLAEDRCPSFEIAASLASVFERLGELTKAGLWLGTATDRAQRDEDGERERLHRAVVSARRDESEDRRALALHNFLNLDFGAGGVPVRPGGLEVEPAALERRLLDLLPEQRDFADLWLVLGDLERLAGGDAETARAAWERAISLGHPRRSLIETRIAAVEAGRRDAARRRWAPYLAAVTLLLAGLALWRVFERMRG